MSAKVRILAALAAFVLAAVLVSCILLYLELGTQEIGWVLGEYGIPLFLAAVVSLIAQAWFSGLKWSALHALAAGADGPKVRLAPFVFYSALGTSLAQLLPAFIAVTALRGMASRLHLRGSFKRGAAVTVYDQGFDAVVLISAALVCAVVYLAGYDTEGVVTALVLLFAGLLLLARPLFAVARPLHHAGILIPSRRGRLARVSEGLMRAHEYGLHAPATAALLIRLSILRYLAIIGRSIAAVLIAAPALAISDAVWGVAVVQSSTLVAVTPGNMGTAEWGWAAVEAVLDVTPGLLVATLLAMRLVTLPASLAVVLLSWPFLVRALPEGATSEARSSH